VFSTPAPWHGLASLVYLIQCALAWLVLLQDSAPR
jgi:hypothetical protein